VKLRGRMPGGPAVEVAVACGAAWIIELLLVLKAPAWTSLSQGPLMLAVLGISTWRGLVWGSVACAVAAVLRAITVAWLVHGLGSMTTPIVSPEVLGSTFFLVVVAGSIGDTWLTRRAAAELAAVDAWTLLDRMSGHYTSLMDQSHLLEVQVQYLADTIPALIAHFDDVDPAHPDAIPQTLVTIARQLAGSGHAVLYDFRKRRQQGERLAMSGGTWPITMDRDNPVITSTLQRGGHVTLAQVRGVSQHTAAPPGAIQVAVEVPVEGGGGHVVLALSDLELVSFAPARLEALERAMRVGGKALARARAFVRTRDLNVEDPVTGAVTHSYFEKRLAEHHALGKRHGHTLSLIRVDVTRPAAGAKSKGRRATRLLADAIRRSLRDGDLLAVGAAPDQYWILCPFTPLAGARVVSGRLSALATAPEIGQVAVAETELDPRSIAHDATLALVTPPPAPNVSGLAS
jgi:hypothetical protein